MGSRVDLSVVIARYGRTLGLLTLPLLLNAAVWAALVAPQRAKLQDWRDAKQLADLKPRLEATLAESHRAIAAWQHTAFTQDDPAAVLQAVKALGERHHVQINMMSAKGQAKGQGDLTRQASQHTPVVSNAPGGGKIMPVALEVVGSFGKLARWMSDVESHAGLQVESWTMAPMEDAQGVQRLDISLTASLQGA